MSSYNLVDQAGLSYAVGKIADAIKLKYVAKADEKTALSQFTNDADYVVDASYVHTDNNFTASLKTKLEGIATGAEVNVLESVKVNGTALTVDQNKAVDITMPTALSDLTDDLGHQANVIETVKVNGSALTPDANKAVDVTVPTAVSDLTNDANYAENVIETVQVNGSALTVTNKTVNVVIPAQATNLSQFTNDADFQTSTDVDAAIASALTATYKASGTIAFASLPTLTAANMGKVYNITNGFTTTADFVEGAGKVYGPGANVAIILASSDPDVYKYDVMADFVDLSGYVEATDITNVTNADIDDIVEDAFADEQSSGD